MKKPNVIFLLTDDQGYGDLACHGNPVACTPHLDQLHAESLRLTDFHVAPMCTPTRGQLLTGLDAARNGAVNVSSGRSLLRADLRTMADHFREGGYRTGLFGKWHLGDNYPYRPQDRGIEESLWFPSSHINSVPDFWENDYFDDVYIHNGERRRYRGYCTEVFFSEAKKWMRRCRKEGNRFLTFLPTNVPHSPLWVPEEDRLAVEAAFAEGEHRLPDLEPELRGQIIRFLGMIRTMDTQLGKLRSFLNEEGIGDDTLLVFLTDNGSTFGPAYYNAGMRGAKCSLWEGGHRVPCFIHWPNGELRAPGDVGGLTEVQDLLPSLIDLCGLPPFPRPLDGRNLAGVLRGDESVPEDRMVAVNYSRMPMGDYPTPDSESYLRREGTAVLWKRWRLLEGTALYDLDRDPGQERNVIDRHPEIARRMLEKLDSWWAEVEPAANEVQRIVIGNEAENPMILSACEWRDVFLDMQKQVRVAERKNSYWELEVERAGTYRFELRRWPRESGLALDEGCPETEVTDGQLPAGEALPIRRARIRIARKEFVEPVESGSESAVFTVDLERGPVRLHTWFDDENERPLCGAYYVHVERTGGPADINGQG